MISSGMFETTPPQFEAIIHTISELQNTLNELIPRYIYNSKQDTEHYTILAKAELNLHS